MTKKTEQREKGVLLLQIDGLPRTQFDRALKAGRLPFLRSLIKAKAQRLISFYPGLPSCTPAVQAEIHYGVRCATPAFSFFDRKTKQEVRMYDSEWARRIAKESLESGAGLLEGGSSYANIYRGGAERAKYCGELNTVQHWTKELSLARLAKLAFRFPLEAGRMVKLLGAELFIGLYDAIKGIRSRGEFLSELKFVPARLAVAIALREAIRREVINDVKEGVPIIHANFFGYDEAAHRRGPHSRFAHWTLKGLDRTVHRIYKAAKRKGKRDYHIVIFSDHGQENCVPYTELTGQNLADVTKDLILKDTGITLSEPSLVSHFMERAKAKEEDEGTPVATADVRTARLQSMGPVAHFYVDDGIPEDRKVDWARQFCEFAQIPFVLFRKDDGSLYCITKDEEGDLEILGDALRASRHRFPEEALQDLQTLLCSEYSGDMVMLGWRPEGKPITFAAEWGAHAGPGPEECHGFALLPYPVATEKDWIRPVQLREIALNILGRQPTPQAEYKNTDTPELTQLRVVTYNVHGGVGTDRRRDTDRLATVLRETEADVLCFQEAFEGSGSDASLGKAVRQALGEEASYLFLPLHHKNGISYGVAMASRHPLYQVKQAAFESQDVRLAKKEPRGAIWAELRTGNGENIQIVNTHLGLTHYERKLQSDILLGPDWLGGLDDNCSVVLCGDFNASPSQRTYEQYADQFADAQEISNSKPKASFYSWIPVRRIDHIFTSEHCRAPRTGTFADTIHRKASDHLPVFADLEIIPNEVSQLSIRSA